MGGGRAADETTEFLIYFIIYIYINYKELNVSIYEENIKMLDAYLCLYLPI